MNLIDNAEYRKVLNEIIGSFPHWNALNSKTILLSGVSGMLGSMLTDVILLRNETLAKADKCRIIGIGRKHETAMARFPKWIGTDEFKLYFQDISEPISISEKADYIIHSASTTHPVQYATEPINTILANVLGCRNMLDIAAANTGSKFLLCSSVEVYGENRGDTEYFSEDYCGYINCNTLRAGYPESKRASEALCQAYSAERSVDVSVIRLSRCYGPTMRMSDSKAIAQFIKKGLNRENIVLKSKGDQNYSYLYTADAVTAMLYVLISGKNGEAYNASDSKSDITLKKLAELIASISGTRVIYELPDAIEQKGYSKATKALMNPEKLNNIGWKARYDIETGLKETLSILY